MTQAQARAQASLRDDFMEICTMLKDLRRKAGQLEKKHGVSITEVSIMPGEADKKSDCGILIHGGIDDLGKVLGIQPILRKGWGMKKWFITDRVFVDQLAEQNSTRFLRAWEKPNAERT